MQKAGGFRLRRYSKTSHDHPLRGWTTRFSGGVLPGFQIERLDLGRQLLVRLVGHSSSDDTGKTKTPSGAMGAHLPALIESAALMVSHQLAKRGAFKIAFNIGPPC